MVNVVIRSLRHIHLEAEQINFGINFIILKSVKNGLITKVLIIEHDDNIYSRIIEQLNTRTSNEFDVLRSTEADLEIISINSFDACLLYWPKQRNLNRLKALRSVLKFKKNVPTIVITQNYQKDLDRKLFKMGVDDCFSLEELSCSLLIRSIRHAIQRKSSEQKLAFISTHDQLTGLANRFLLKQHLEHTIGLAKRSNSQFAVMLLDIDKFKRFNDSLGPEYGDKLLVAVSERLKHCVRTTDIVARFGSDEFAILLENYGGVRELGKIAEKIQHNLKPAIEVNGQEFYITTSVGIAIFPECGIEANTLIKSAEAALHKAKDLGRNQFNFYSGDLNQSAQLKLELEKNLRRALIKGELEIYLQPQINPKTQKVAGAEALLRWQHPTRGLIPPSLFIPILEEMNLLVGVEAWVLNQVCQLAKKFTDVYGDFRFSVNISGSHFKKGNLKENVFIALQSSSLEAKYLEVELTEDIMIEHVERNNKLLNELKELDISIALDDFGKGFSSLSYLKNFPVDILKIDKVFIQNMVADKRDLAIVESLIELAHKLGIRVVAEGVEDNTQLNRLSSLNCDYIQGFFYSRPLPIFAFEDFIQKNMIAKQPANSIS